MDHSTNSLTRRTLISAAAFGLAATLPRWTTIAIAAPPAGGPSLTPDQALAKLQQGNRAFLAGEAVAPGAQRRRRLEIAPAQHPFAIVVTCSDSRVPPEALFAQGLGDLFVIRNAGNTIDTAAMGSLEYAALELNVPLVVVMGHERCGAVGAAVAVVEQGTTFPGSIGRMVEPIVPAALDARRQGASDLLDASVRANVGRQVRRLRDSEPTLRERLREGRLRIVGARYDLDDGHVDFFDEGPTAR